MTPISVLIFFLSGCAGFTLGWFFHAALSTDLDAPLERLPADAMRKFQVETLELRIKELEEKENYEACMYAKELLETIKADY